MGWISYHANYYKNEKVDKKKECDSYFIEGLNKGFYKINKSSMIGNIYYAAVTVLKKYNKDKIIIDIPKLEQKTFAVVFVTSVRNKDYYNFSYKPMDETMGPCYYDCPVNILKLLSDTDNEYALKWRQECWNNHKQKKNFNSINKLPEISFTKDELIVLGEYLRCNPCETKINCKVKLPIVNGKGDCNAKDKNGKEC